MNHDLLNFAMLVKKMRGAQGAYFKEKYSPHRDLYFKEAVKLENEVDQKIEQLSHLSQEKLL